MNPTPQQLARARAAADQLKERGPGNGRGPVSFTRDPSLYIEAIARAVLEDVAEPVFEWRHWQTSPHLGKRGRYGPWRSCTREEFERTDNNSCTQKRTRA